MYFETFKFVLIKFFLNYQVTVFLAFVSVEKIYLMIKSCTLNFFRDFEVLK